MRLRVSQAPKNKRELSFCPRAAGCLVASRLDSCADTKMVTGVGWTPSNELFTVSDEKLVMRWSLAGEPGPKICDLDSFATDFHWYSASRGAGQASREEFFAVGCSDGAFRAQFACSCTNSWRCWAGTFRLINKTGRVEKTVEAHT